MDEIIHLRGATIVIKVATPRLTLIDYTAPAGFPGPPLHVHPGYDDVFQILEGTLTMRIEDMVFEADPGEVVRAAGDIPHTFANTSPDPVRFLSICAPGGFERYLRALAANDQRTADEVMEGFGYAPVITASSSTA
jgi:mannose-6-phosphate isomerase-like protein (cupin superfamily)